MARTTKKTTAKSARSDPKPAKKKAAAKKAAAKKTVTKKAAPKTAATKKTAAKKTGSKKAPTKRKATGGTTVRSAAGRIPAEERRRLIAEAAYLRAEARGFLGDAHEDWLVAEGEVDARLARAGILVDG